MALRLGFEHKFQSCIAFTQLVRTAMTKARTSFLLFSSLLFASCAPLPIYRLNPIADDTIWINGREAARKSDFDIEATVSFVRTEDSQLVFAIEITNWTSVPLTVSPER